MEMPISPRVPRRHREDPARRRGGQRAKKSSGKTERPRCAEDGPHGRRLSGRQLGVERRFNLARTPSTRVVSIRRGRGCFFFEFEAVWTDRDALRAGAARRVF